MTYTYVIKQKLLLSNKYNSPVEIMLIINDNILQDTLPLL